MSDTPSDEPDYSAVDQQALFDVVRRTMVSILSAAVPDPRHAAYAAGLCEWFIIHEFAKLLRDADASPRAGASADGVLNHLNVALTAMNMRTVRWETMQ
jgi:hypothetical protein